MCEDEAPWCPFEKAIASAPQPLVVRPARIVPGGWRLPREFTPNLNNASVMAPPGRGSSVEQSPCCL